jgi:hypothetical protein
MGVKIMSNTAFGTFIHAIAFTAMAFKALLAIIVFSAL